ncbi:21960_t:CDS:2, partial [Gigaspora rosea]
NTKPSKHYQRSAEIREDSEAHEVDKKVAEVERVDEVTKPNLNNKIKIKEEGPRECRDLAEIDGLTEETIYTIFKWQSKNAKGTPKERSNYKPYYQNNVVMISTLRPLGLYIEELVAHDTGYIKETSIGVDIYIKYYKSAKMWYRDKAYNLGYRHQMGIIIEKERYKVVGRPMYTRIAISKIISPRNWNKLRIRKHPSKSRKELEKLYIIHYIKGLEKDISLYVSWYAVVAFDPGGINKLNFVLLKLN